MEQATGIYRADGVLLTGKVNWPDGTPVRVVPCGVAPTKALDRAGRMVIAGLGLSGHFVLEWCRKHQISAICVDGNAETVARLVKAGTPAIQGSICDEAVLDRAEVGTASAVAVMVPDEQQMLRAVKAIRRRSATVLIFARSNFNKTAQEARLAGADEVVDQEGLVAYEILGRLDARLCPRPA